VRSRDPDHPSSQSLANRETRREEVVEMGRALLRGGADGLGGLAVPCPGVHRGLRRPRFRADEAERLDPRRRDFDAPLAGAQVLDRRDRPEARDNDQGNFVLPDVPPGKYTLVFSKDGYVRQVKSRRAGRPRAS
jgi:hypothetical protein